MQIQQSKCTDPFFNNLGLFIVGSSFKFQEAMQDFCLSTPYLSGGTHCREYNKVNLSQTNDW